MILARQPQEIKLFEPEGIALNSLHPTIIHVQHFLHFMQSLTLAETIGAPHLVEERNQL